MSVIVHGLYAGCAVIEDAWGLELIPLSTVSAIGNAIDKREVVELDSCHRCVDGPAVTTDHNDKQVCLKHAPNDGDDR